MRTYDFVSDIDDVGLAVVGGFQSPMEKECLAVLLRARQPVVVCPARSIESMRLPVSWREPLDDGRLLILSPFAPHQRRPTQAAAHIRNQFVASLADEVLVAHAAPGGRTEAFCREILASGKPLLTFDSPHNAELIALGARIVR